MMEKRSSSHANSRSEGSALQLEKKMVEKRTVGKRFDMKKSTEKGKKMNRNAFCKRHSETWRCDDY